MNKNKGNYQIIYKNKEYKLNEYFDNIDNNYNINDLIKIKLRIINNICNFSYMFKDCDKLLLLSEENAYFSNTKKFESRDIIGSSFIESDCLT